MGTKALRRADANEQRYLQHVWRLGRQHLLVLGIVCGASGLALGGLMLAGLGGSHVESDTTSTVIEIGFACLAGLLLFAAQLTLVRAARRGPPPAAPIERLEGPWRVETADEEATRYFISDRQVQVPQHWILFMERRGALPSLSAEGAPGPGPEMILVALGDHLSVSREVDRGLLDALPTALPLYAFLSFIALVIAGLVAAARPDRELSLKRYLTVGRLTAHFASAAAYRAAPPPPYTPTVLDNVLLTNDARGQEVAVDAPPAPPAEAAALASRAALLAACLWDHRLDPSVRCVPLEVDAGSRLEELERLLAAREQQARVIEKRGDRLAPDLRYRTEANKALLDAARADARSRRVEALFTDGRRYIEQAERAVGAAGVPVAGTSVAELVRAAEVVRGHGDGREFDDLRRFQSAFGRLAVAFSQRQTVHGVVMPVSGVVASLVVGPHYRRGTLIAQGAALGIGLLTAVLVAASVREKLRRQVAIYALEAALSPTLRQEV
jgi:hypothetical protein